MKVIVIPVCETNDKCQGYLTRLLESIRIGGYYPSYSVVLCFDNCSPEFVSHFQTKFEGDKIMGIASTNPTNLNFCKNVNIGFRAAFNLGAKHICLLNMDTILPPVDVFDQLWRGGLSFPVPVHNPEGVLSQKVIQTKVTPVNRWSGFCMCFNTSVVEKIGVLDERFTASFEDDDVCVRAKLAGFPVEVVEGVEVHHELKDRTSPSNTGAYDENDLGIHRDIFRRKYTIPYVLQHEQFADWILDNFTWDDVFRCP